MRKPILLALVLTVMFVTTSCGGGASGAGLAAGGGSGNGGGGGNGGSNGNGSSQSCNVMTLGIGGSLNSFRPFPADNLWNRDISASAIDPNSSAIINFLGPSIGLHADFGSGQYQGSNLGIPYVVVGSSQSLVNVNFTAYGDESDPGPMPIPGNAPIEGDPNPGGDRHLLVLDNSHCFLYELFGAIPDSNGTWNADSTAVWDMLASQQRPWTWTSADAAGLPIFPGLARYDEVAAGAIEHALRFTVSQSRAAFTPPASHWASSSSNVNAPPMGMRLRLKANYDISSFPTSAQVILTALKRYGMILADNGSSMFISGAPDNRWDNDALHTLSRVTASSFEVVQMDQIYSASNLPQGSSPVIHSFTATPSAISPGASVTLAWSINNSSYVIVSPGLGAVRGTAVTTNPNQTTTYTLYAANQYGRSIATVTVIVN